MRLIRQASAVALATAMMVAGASAATAGSDAWASSSSPLKILYNGANLGYGWGWFYAEPTSSETIGSINDNVANGLPVYGTSTVAGDRERSSNTSVGANIYLTHSYSSRSVATAGIQLGEDAPWRPDILSSYYYVSANT